MTILGFESPIAAPIKDNEIKTSCCSKAFRARCLQSMPTYPEMTGFFAKGASPEGRREAAGKQTRLVSAMAGTNKYLAKSRRGQSAKKRSIAHGRIGQVSGSEIIAHTLIAGLSFGCPVEVGL